MKIEDAILGMEVRCPDGIGRISQIGESSLGKGGMISVDTYINNRGCNWSPENVSIWIPKSYLELGTAIHEDFAKCHKIIADQQEVINNYQEVIKYYQDHLKRG